jgi:BASS family bile acid:Na+ symporter
MGIALRTPNPVRPGLWWNDSVLKTIVDTGVPAIVFFAMVVVGMDLTANDFRRVTSRPWTVLGATVGQLVVLPLIGWVLVRCFGTQPDIGRGMLLVTACPSGTMANVYVFLARANLALSVTLTAVSCLAAVLTMPLALAMLEAGVGEEARLPVPLAMLAGQLVLLLCLPVLAGMGIRWRWPAITKRHGRTLLGLSIAALAVLLGMIVGQETGQFASALAEIVGAATFLTVLAFGAGWATGLASGGGSTDRFTVGMVFVVRNVGIATAIAVTALGRAEFAVFATAYFLAQVPLLLVAALAFRWLWAAGEINSPGVDHP